MKKKRALNPRFIELFENKPRKGELRKLQIVEAAVDLIALRGVRQLSFESIGVKLGIGRAHVAYHFKSIDSLIESVAKLITATAQGITVERVRAAGDWREQVRAYIEGAFMWCEQHPRQASAFLLINYLCTYDSRHRALHSEIRDAGLARISTILEPHLRAGRGRRERAQLVGKGIQCLIRGSIFDAVTVEPRVSLERAREEAVTLAFQLIAAS